jgi:hypothetical protein
MFEGVQGCQPARQPPDDVPLVELLPLLVAEVAPVDPVPEDPRSRPCVDGSPRSQATNAKTALSAAPPANEDALNGSNLREAAQP